MANVSSATRNDLFQQLKPRCVAINSLALRSSDKKANGKDLIKATQDLYSVLENHVLQNSTPSLDEKLADYVLVPLISVLRDQEQYPVQLTEVIIKCFRLLVDHGWKAKIPKDLAHQFLILLTFIIAGVPGKERKEPIPEETVLEAFKALNSLIKAAGLSPQVSSSLLDADSIPTLGHAISIVLDGVTDGPTPEVQLEALSTVSALCSAIRDRTALATFFPGMVSSLARLLTPPGALKTRKSVLISGVNTLKALLVKVLGDMKLTSILNDRAKQEVDQAGDGKVLTASWLKATVAKVKLAMVSVLKLRKHPSEDVSSALASLCIILLDECHQSLSDCAGILVETAMMLNDPSKETSALETSLTDLARIYPELTETIKITAYNWVTSLPRLMQAGDEQTKQQGIQNILKGRYFVNELQIDSTTLEDSLTISLRDSTTALVLSPGENAVVSELPSSSLELAASNPDNQISTQQDFRPVLIARDTEKSTRDALLHLISEIGSTSRRNKLASDMLDYARESSGPSQVASYWLSFELVKSSLSQSVDMNEFLDFGTSAEPSEEEEIVLQELYSFSVAILDSQAEADLDWRVQALALEVATFTASRMGEAFRPELIDVLYPIATFLGSESPLLRSHTIISLNNVAASCGYSDVTELVIDNVDYMVNSVSLRLNTFDISPASTQVLRMMVRLTGPKLIPYLDDVVASIFAALENFHGYPVFVESLFGVLNEVVEQGAKSDRLLLQETKEAVTADHHKKSAGKKTSAQDVLETLTRRIERQSTRKEDDKSRDEDAKSHPKRPWSKTNPADNPNIENRHKTRQNTDDEEEEEEEEDDEDPGPEPEKPKPPKTPTFTLLTRITSLTQHYLTSPTPSLRKSLLDLLTTVCPALSPDEEAFLPLVNAIWPVLVERIHDREPYVVVSACGALSSLCASSGDFLATRLRTEWINNGLGRWCAGVKREAEAGNGNERIKKMKKERFGGGGGGGDLLLPIRSTTITTSNSDGVGVGIGNNISSLSSPSSPKEMMISSTTTNYRSGSGLGPFTQSSQIWRAVRDLLISVVSHVTLDDDIFDQILGLLLLLPSDDDDDTTETAKEALEAVDPDKVWLALYRRRSSSGKEKKLRQPRMEGVGFVEV